MKGERETYVERKLATDDIGENTPRRCTDDQSDVQRQRRELDS